MHAVDDLVTFLAGVVRAADGGARPQETGVFARAYLQMTLEEIARIQDGTFEDPAWMAGFSVSFGSRYAAALEDREHAPRPWQIALDSDARGQRRTIRALLLGVNAHMSYDLTLTLVEDVLDDPERRRPDYEAVNRVIAHAVGRVQRDLEDRYGEWLRWADALGGRLDEQLTRSSFQDARAIAWLDALRMLDGNLTREELERRVAAKAVALTGLAY